MADVKDAFDAIFVRVGAKFLPVVQELADKVIKFLPKVFQLFDRLSPILEKLFDKLMPVLEDLMDNVLPIIMDILEEIAPVIAHIIEELAPLISEILQAILPVVAELVKELLPIIVELFDKFVPILERFIPLIEPILKIVLALLQPLLLIIDKCLMPLIDLIANGLCKALEALAPILTNVANWFDDVFHRIPEIAKKALNALIGFLNKCIRGINAMIEPLMNAIEAVGGFFGASWDLSNVRIPQIPMLAKGGILSRGSAIVGEAGPELLTVAGGKSIVQPLTNNYDNHTNLGGITINVTQTDGESSYALANRISEILADQYGRERAVYA